MLNPDSVSHVCTRVRHAAFAGVVAVVFLLTSIDRAESAENIRSTRSVISATANRNQPIASADGFKFRGSWNSSTAYFTNDVVTYGGSTWLAVVRSTDQEPGAGASGSGSRWALLAQRGSDGTPGADGANGSLGVAGPAGVAGSVGPQGGMGPSGPPGLPGSQGSQGPQGPQGLQGPSGSPGAAGATGPQGLVGNTGPMGAAGAAGAIGPAGPQGPVGPMGPAGSVGATGATGAAGTAGPQGLVGNIGPIGAAGAAGAIGPAGPQGPAGPVGPVGSIGATGASGAAGSTGATGLQGSVGPQGPAGQDGAGVLVSDDQTNIGVGPGALRGNKDGRSNTAIGADSLYADVSGNDNTAIGYQTLVNSEGSANIAVGALAGVRLNKGDRNIYVGNPGTDAEDGVIRFGEDGLQTRTFIAGIANVTTSDKAAAVVIDQFGQLGTISSSRRYKQNIESMAGSSDRVLGLRPVTFRYKEAAAAGDRTLQFGLVAEEVAEVFPELVVYNTHGQPETVAYHLLAPLLLNELQKEHALNVQYGGQLLRQEALLQDMQGRLAAMESAMNQATHATEPGP